MNERENGTSINPKMNSPLHLKEYLRMKVYLSALKIKNLETADEEVIFRLKDLISNLPYSSKHFILAFDKHYDEFGNMNLNKTEFFTPNEYILKLSNENPNYFLPCASIHPNRKDALIELEKMKNQGVKMIKWLPNAQGINPADTKHIIFYKKMIEYKMILLTHAGEEKAVEAEDDQKLGNPLRLKLPLDLGLKIIIAHAASLGEDIDLESPDLKKVKSFDLFIRLMENPKYQKNLFGDISAIIQFNRDAKILKTLLERKHLHARLVNGSDYPLPSVNMVIQLHKLKSFLPETEINLLREIFEYNPILFDFVLKRNLNWQGNKFADSVFLENKLLEY
jgi:predicted TIM-barrel fold metal-dependent hydrolase